MNTTHHMIAVATVCTLLISFPVASARGQAKVASPDRGSGVHASVQGRLLSSATGTGHPDTKIIQRDIIVSDWFGDTCAPFATNLWPNGIVLYLFDDNVNPEQQDAALAAMLEWELVAAVAVVPRTSEPHFLIIWDSRGQVSSGHEVTS